MYFLLVLCNIKFNNKFLSYGQKIMISAIVKTARYLTLHNFTVRRVIELFFSPWCSLVSRSLYFIDWWCRIWCRYDTRWGHIRGIYINCEGNTHTNHNQQGDIPLHFTHVLLQYVTIVFLTSVSMHFISGCAYSYLET